MSERMFKKDVSTLIYVQMNVWPNGPASCFLLLSFVALLRELTE
jgi:hypothetical protein